MALCVLMFTLSLKYIQYILDIGINLFYTHTGTYSKIFDDNQFIPLSLAYNSYTHQGAHKPDLVCLYLICRILMQIIMHTSCAYTSALYTSSIFCAHTCMHACKIQNVSYHVLAACMLELSCTLRMWIRIINEFVYCRLISYICYY